MALFNSETFSRRSTSEGYEYSINKKSLPFALGWLLAFLPLWVGCLWLALVGFSAFPMYYARHDIGALAMCGFLALPGIIATVAIIWIPIAHRLQLRKYGLSEAKLNQPLILMIGHDKVTLNKHQNVQSINIKDITNIIIRNRENRNHYLSVKKDFDLLFSRQHSVQSRPSSLADPWIRPFGKALSPIDMHPYEVHLETADRIFAVAVCMNYKTAKNLARSIIQDAGLHLSELPHNPEYAYAYGLSKHLEQG